MRKIVLVLLSSVFVLLLTFVSFAGTWKSDANGWWWDNGNGTYPKAQWQWCDGNNDGIAECYYFDANGYCLLNTTTPDGYQVDANGAWVVNGQVQTMNVARSAVNQDIDESKVKGYYTVYAVRTQYNTMLNSSLGFTGYIDLKQNGIAKVKPDNAKVGTFSWYCDDGAVVLEDAYGTTFDLEYVNGVLVWQADKGAFYYAKKGADTSWIGAITLEQYLNR